MSGRPQISGLRHEYAKFTVQVDRPASRIVAGIDGRGKGGGGIDDVF